MIERTDGSLDLDAERTGEYLRERRAHVRVELGVPALVDSTRTWERCLCGNLSEGGLALRATNHFEVGESLDVYFELPGAVAIETASRVVSVRDEWVHVEFDRLTGEQRLNVFRYVVSRKPPRRRLTGTS